MVAPALLLRVFVFGTYVVTSPSMEPALRVGDHIVAWKRALVDAPSAWDIVLLSPGVDNEVPQGVEALVKRVVAAPRDASEFVSLRDGDLWAGPAPNELSLRRRSRELIDAQLQVVQRSEGLDAAWQGVGASSLAAGGLLLDGEGAPAALRFGRAVRDGNASEPGHDVVHDTGLELELAHAFTRGHLRLRLREGADVYEARITARADGVSLSLQHNLAGGVALAEARVATLGPGPLRFLNVDDELHLELNGEPLLSGPVGPAAELPPGAALNNAPAIEFSGGRLELAALSVLRDQHYTAQGRFGTRASGGFPVYEVPAGSLFVLGDDSRRSRDSRHLGALPGSVLLGRPFALYQPGERRRWLDRQGL